MGSSESMFRTKGLYAVEEYLQARYYMFRQVYFHGSLRSAEAVLISILDRALELMKQGQLDIDPASPVLLKILKRDPLTTSEYLDLTITTDVSDQTVVAFAR